MNGFVGDLSHDAGEFVIDAVDYAPWTGSDEIAGNDADRGMRHRRIRQALAESGFDVQAQFAGSLFRALHCRAVGDPDAVMETRLDITQPELFLYLRTRAVDDHHLDTERMQER